MAVRAFSHVFVGLAVLVGALPTLAVVDMKAASYADSWIDISIPGAAYPLRVQRFYNSRSNFNGIFGFGWCSEYETTLEKLPEGGLKLVECGAGQEIVYRPAKFNPAELDRTVSAIVEAYRKKNPGTPAERLRLIGEQIKDEPATRLELAQALEIKGRDAERNVVYRAEGLEVERMTFDGTNFVRVLQDGNTQRFNAQGQLVALIDRNQNTMRIRWQGERIQDVTDPKNRRLAFTFTNKRVAEISGPGGVKAEYEYKGETLVSVKNMWRNTYKFEYDDARNLTKILYPDNSFKALTYNTKQDWVTSYTDKFANGRTCTESYEYNVDPKRPKDRFWSTAVKKCGNEIENQARFEFIMDKTADGRRYMQRVKTESMTDKLEITYHPEFGRPTFINRNGQRTSFTYYDSGLIRQKDTDASKMTFQYHASNNKVSRVVTEFLDTQGKTARRRETTFQYDRKNNLVSARNSDGQSVSLTYDEKGRIASIIDQAKKEVLIRYDERTGKPATITRPKIGTITISYKPNGEILKVDSADGPTVAVQIASTFNNLLDIISPATSELEI